MLSQSSSSVDSLKKMALSTAPKFYNLSQIGHDDVLHISDLSLDSFLSNLKVRYMNGVYYTYIGEVCVSVNPNRPNMNIYGTDYMNMYYGKLLHQMPPHIFAIAGCAYQQTFEHNKDSCVVITGESGSGKTEASKLLHLFIAHIVKMKEQISQTSETLANIASVESILLSSNCILEAFGNARTLRNLNSSRFGKYTEIYFSRNNLAKKFDENFQAKSEQHFYAIIHNYMLEKSRVIEQQNGERNFHAFYQLLASLNDGEGNYRDLLQQLDLANDTTRYKYLDSGNHSIVTDQDRNDFKMVTDAMQIVGFSQQEQETVFHILAAILHLGNVQFESIEDEREFSCDEYSQFIVAATLPNLEHFCRLLSLDLPATLEVLCSRKIRTRQEVMSKPYRKVEAIYGRDALAKALYERVFYFILDRINRSLLKSKPSVDQRKSLITNTIGILDIYGFEVFNSQPNLFEQFLVNYCNEKLHQLFVDVILHKEQLLYDQEDIQWQMVEFEDNLPICLLMDEPHKGIFALLDEACTSGQNYTDQMILIEFNTRFAKHDHFQSRMLNPALRHLCSQDDFIIRHYAGDVHYTIDGFMHKNMDRLYVDYKQLMHTSDSPLIKDMWKDGNKDEKEPVHKLPLTTGLEFRRSMSELIDRLSSKHQLFVRCIKPNEDLNDDSVDKFNDLKVRHQIQYLGLVENARVSKAGFVSRIPYQSFVQRYRMLNSRNNYDFNQQNLVITENDSDLRPIYLDACKDIIDSNWDDPKDSECDQKDYTNEREKDSPSDVKLTFGKTMIFLRDLSIVECLEKKRFEYLEKIILEIQTYSRSVLAKQRFTRLKLAQEIITQFSRVKKYKLMEQLFVKLKLYKREMSVICENTPSDLLEYYQLEPFQWPDQLLELQNDKLMQQLPDLVNQLNKWLIILKFPLDYWNDKLLRLEACKIFWNNKVDWGETRRRWLGNYLTSPNECPQHTQFTELFKLKSAIFQNVLFASYVLKTNAYNLERIRALVMTEMSLYKVDIDSMKSTLWFPIQEIQSVSVTPDADQLIVLHTKSRASDVVFSFYSLKDCLGISSAHSALNNNTKVGEFITLLCRQYQIQTNSPLKVNFTKQIKFKFANEPKYIEVKPCGQASDKLYSGYSNRIASFFTIKRFRQFYMQAMPHSIDRSEQELLAKRIEFEKVARDNYVLIYNA